MLPQFVKYSLFTFGIYHLFAGTFVLGPLSWAQKFGGKVYKLDIPSQVDTKYFVCLKFLGLMAIMVSALSFVLAYSSDQLAQELALILFGLIFLGRSLLRWIFRDEFLQEYNLEFKRSVKNMIFNSCLAIYTFVLAWMSYAAR